MNIPAEQRWMQIAQEVAEGGLLRLVASKPVQQAIGRLVSGAADVPTAWFEGLAQRIRSDNEAEMQIASVVTAAAKELAADDRGLAEAGLDRWANKLKGRQRSVDEVAARTVALLAEEGMSSEAKAPQEDFMRMFEDIAERASSEDVADLLARILAGAIRKPCSVSLRTLQVVSVVDQEIAAALKEIAPFCLDGGLLHISPSRAQNWHGRLDLLNSVSIITRSDGHAITFNTDGRSGFRQGSKSIVISSPGSTKFPLFIDTARLTPIGEELLSILPLGRGSNVMEIASGFKEIPQVDDVYVGDIEEGDSGWRAVNLIRL